MTVLFGALSPGLGIHTMFFQNKGYVKTTAVIDHRGKGPGGAEQAGQSGPD